MLKSLFGTEEGDEMNNDEQSDDYDSDDQDEQISERKRVWTTSDDEGDSGVDWSLYHKMVKESQGFDVPELPVLVSGQTAPLTDLNEHMKELIFCCKLALEHYREKEGKKLVFVKVLKANLRTISGVVYLYYITFEAKDSHKQVDVYQAEVCYNFLKKELCEVHIMRPKPKPADGASSSSGSSCESSPGEGDASQDRDFLQQVIMRLKGYRLW